MALDTYAGQSAALARLLNRDDLTDDIPNFIALFEATFDADPKTARHRRRICRSESDIENEYETTATNFLTVQSAALADYRADGLYDDADKWQLDYIDPDSMVRLIEDKAAWAALNTNLLSTTTAPPKYYTVVGTELRFFPAPTTTYHMFLTVYERLDAASGNPTSQWVLTYFPHLYLYGAAVHSAPFLGADDRLPTWQALYGEARDQLMQSDPMPTNKLPLRSDALAIMAGRRRGVFV